MHNIYFGKSGKLTTIKSIFLKELFKSSVPPTFEMTQAGEKKFRIKVFFSWLIRKIKLENLESFFRQVGSLDQLRKSLVEGK